MRGSRLLPVLLVLALVLAPFASDADQTCNGQTTIGEISFTYIDTPLEFSAGNSTEIVLMVENTGSVVHSVKVTENNNTPFSISGDVFFGIESGEIAEKTIVISAPATTKRDTYDLELRFTVDSADSRVAPLQIKLDSAVTGEQFNKILGIFENPFPKPFDDVNCTVAISMLIWFGISLLAVGVIQIIAKIAFKDKKDSVNIDRKLKASVFVLVMVSGVVNCLNIAGVDPEIVAAVNFWVTLFFILNISYIVWKVYKAVVSRILNGLEKKTGNEWIYESFSSLFFAIGKILIVTVSVATLLSALGLNLAVIITGAGIAGIAVSLGTKSAFNELFSGMSLLVMRPFTAGDSIILDDEKEDMTVVKVGILNTEFKTIYNVDHFVLSNSVLAQSKITNLTKETRNYRTFVYVHLDKNEDPELVKKLMLEAAYESPDVISDGRYDLPSVRLNEYSGGRAIYRLSVFIKDYRDNGNTCGRLREAIFAKFKANNIFIPVGKADITVLEDRRGAAE